MHEQQACPFIESAPARAGREECPGTINQCCDLTYMTAPPIIGSRVDDVARALLRFCRRKRKRARNDREVKQGINPADCLIHRHMLLRLCCLHERKSEMKTIRHED